MSDDLESATRQLLLHLSVFDPTGLPTPAALAASNAFTVQFVAHPLAFRVAELLLTQPGAPSIAHLYALQIACNVLDPDVLLRLIAPVSAIRLLPLHEKLAGRIADGMLQFFPQRWPRCVEQLMLAAGSGGSPTSAAALVFSALHTVVLECTSTDFASRLPPARKGEVVQGLMHAAQQLLPALSHVLGQALAVAAVPQQGGATTTPPQPPSFTAADGSDLHWVLARGIALMGSLRFLPQRSCREHGLLGGGDAGILPTAWRLCCEPESSGEAASSQLHGNLVRAVVAAAESQALRKLSEHAVDSLAIQCESLELLGSLMASSAHAQGGWDAGGSPAAPSAPQQQHQALLCRLGLEDFRLLAAALCTGASGLADAVYRGCKRDGRSRSLMFALTGQAVGLLGHGSVIVRANAAGLLSDLLRAGALSAAGAPAAVDLAGRATPHLIRALVKEPRFAWTDLGHRAPARLHSYCGEGGGSTPAWVASQLYPASSAAAAASSRLSWEEFALEEAEEYALCFVAGKSRATLLLREILGAPAARAEEAREVGGGGGGSGSPAAQVSGVHRGTPARAAAAAGALEAAQVSIAATRVVQEACVSALRALSSSSGHGADPCLTPYGTATPASGLVLALDAALIALEQALLPPASAGKGAASSPDVQSPVERARTECCAAVFEALMACATDDPVVLVRISHGLTAVLAPRWYEQRPDTLSGVLRLLFAHIEYEPSLRLLAAAAGGGGAGAAGPGSTSASQALLAADAQYVRQRACGGLVALSRSIAPVLLPALQPLANEALRLLGAPSSRLDPADRVSLYEMLALVSNALAATDPAAHASFLDQLVAAPLAGWTASPAFASALGGPWEMLQHLGLATITPAGAPAETLTAAVSTLVERLDELGNRLHLTWALARRCTTEELLRAGGAPASAAASGPPPLHPFTRYWPVLLPRALALLRCLHALWEPSVVAALLFAPAPSAGGAAGDPSALAFGLVAVPGAGTPASISVAARFLYGLSKEEAAVLARGELTGGAAARGNRRQHRGRASAGAAGAGAGGEEQGAEDSSEEEAEQGGAAVGSAPGSASAQPSPLLPVIAVALGEGGGVAYTRAWDPTAAAALDAAWRGAGGARTHAGASLFEYLATWSARVTWHLSALLVSAAKGHLLQPPLHATPTAAAVALPASGNIDEDPPAGAHSAGDAAAAAAVAQAQQRGGGFFSAESADACLSALADALSPPVLPRLPVRLLRGIQQQLLLPLLECCPPSLPVMARLLPTVLSVVEASVAAMAAAGSGEGASATPASLLPLVGLLLPDASRSAAFLDGAREATVTETGRVTMEVVLALVSPQRRLVAAGEGGSGGRCPESLGDLVLLDSPESSCAVARAVAGSLAWRDAAAASSACRVWGRVIPRVFAAPPAPQGAGSAVGGLRRTGSSSSSLFSTAEVAAPVVDPRVVAAWTGAAGEFFLAGVELLCTSAAFILPAEKEVIGALAEIYCVVGLGLPPSAAIATTAPGGPEAQGAGAGGGVTGAGLSAVLQQRAAAEGAAGRAGPALMILSKMRVSGDALHPFHEALARAPLLRTHRRDTIRELLQAIASAVVPEKVAADLGVRAGSMVRPAQRTVSNLPEKLLPRAKDAVAGGARHVDGGDPTGGGGPSLSSLFGDDS